MCGVAGYSCSDPRTEHLEILDGIIHQSKIRGLHSFGYSICNDGLKTYKHHDIREVDLKKAKKIIYHNRYSTSGDYRNHDNNQPINVEGVSLVFNGVLDMRTKEEMMNHYEIRMNSDNDGEILLRLCQSDPKKIQNFVSSTTGSFAGLILNESNEMYAIRNKNRPLWKLIHDNATFYASTRDIFMRVNASFDPVLLEPNKIYSS
jgi:glucosamine 6-phosphate synthetase-like amidotransferase/phosphosugar isomerase protein